MAIKIDRENRLLAREAALDFLEQFWADAEGQVRFPVDPVAIAKRLGASVQLADLEQKVAGVLLRENADEAPKIMLNKSDPVRRQRFTCAHELGHIARRHDSPDAMGYVEYRNELSGEGTDPEEIFANAFAAELLMPGSAVRKFWSEGIGAPKIARIFNVSSEALAVRLESLGLDR